MNNIDETMLLTLSNFSLATGIPSYDISFMIAHWSEFTDERLNAVYQDGSMYFLGSEVQNFKQEYTRFKDWYDNTYDEKGRLIYRDKEDEKEALTIERSEEPVYENETSDVIAEDDNNEPLPDELNIEEQDNGKKKTGKKVSVHKDNVEQELAAAAAEILRLNNENYEFQKNEESKREFENEIKRNNEEIEKHRQAIIPPQDTQIKYSEEQTKFYQERVDEYRINAEKQREYEDKIKEINKELDRYHDEASQNIQKYNEPKRGLDFSGNNNGFDADKYAQEQRERLQKIEDYNREINQIKYNNSKLTEQVIELNREINVLYSENASNVYYDAGKKDEIYQAKKNEYNNELERHKRLKEYEDSISKQVMEYNIASEKARTETLVASISQNSILSEEEKMSAYKNAEKHLSDIIVSESAKYQKYIDQYHYNEMEKPEKQSAEYNNRLYTANSLVSKYEELEATKRDYEYERCNIERIEALRQHSDDSLKVKEISDNYNAAKERIEREYNENINNAKIELYKTGNTDFVDGVSNELKYINKEITNSAQYLSPVEKMAIINAAAETWKNNATEAINNYTDDYANFKKRNIDEQENYLIQKEIDSYNAKMATIQKSDAATAQLITSSHNHKLEQIHIEAQLLAEQEQKNAISLRTQNDNAILYNSYQMKVDAIKEIELPSDKLKKEKIASEDYLVKNQRKINELQILETAMSENQSAQLLYNKRLNEIDANKNLSEAEKRQQTLKVKNDYEARIDKISEESNIDVLNLNASTFNSAEKDGLTAIASIKSLKNADSSVIDILNQRSSNNNVNMTGGNETVGIDRGDIRDASETEINENTVGNDQEAGDQAINLFFKNKNNVSDNLSKIGQMVESSAKQLIVGGTDLDSGFRPVQTAVSVPVEQLTALGTVLARFGGNTSKIDKFDLSTLTQGLDGKALNVDSVMDFASSNGFDLSGLTNKELKDLLKNPDDGISQAALYILNKRRGKSFDVEREQFKSFYANKNITDIHDIASIRKLAQKERGIILSNMTIKDLKRLASGADGVELAMFATSELDYRKRFKRDKEASRSSLKFKGQFKRLGRYIIRGTDFADGLYTVSQTLHYANSAIRHAYKISSSMYKNITSYRELRDAKRLSKLEKMRSKSTNRTERMEKRINKRTNKINKRNANRKLRHGQFDRVNSVLNKLPHRKLMSWKAALNKKFRDAVRHKLEGSTVGLLLIKVSAKLASFLAGMASFFKYAAIVILIALVVIILINYIGGVGVSVLTSSYFASATEEKTYLEKGADYLSLDQDSLDTTWKNEVENLTNVKTPAGVSGGTFVGYNSPIDGSPIAITTWGIPSNNGEVTQKQMTYYYNGDGESLINYPSNAKSILSYAEIKMSYGGSDDGDTQEASDANGNETNSSSQKNVSGLDWSYSKYQKYLERVFDASHTYDPYDSGDWGINPACKMHVNGGTDEIGLSAKLLQCDEGCAEYKWFCNDEACDDHLDGVLIKNPDTSGRKDAINCTTDAGGKCTGCVDISSIATREVGGFGDTTTVTDSYGDSHLVNISHLEAVDSTTNRVVATRVNVADPNYTTNITYNVSQAKLTNVSDMLSTAYGLSSSFSLTSKLTKLNNRNNFEMYEVIDEATHEKIITYIPTDKYLSSLNFAYQGKTYSNITSSVTLGSPSIIEYTTRSMFGQIITYRVATLYISSVTVNENIVLPYHYEYSVCNGHTAKYCTGHAELIARALVLDLSDDVDKIDNTYKYFPSLDSGELYDNSTSSLLNLAARNNFVEATDVGGSAYGAYKYFSMNHNVNVLVESKYSDGNKINWFDFSDNQKVFAYLESLNAIYDEDWKEIYDIDLPYNAMNFESSIISQNIIDNALQYNPTLESSLNYDMRKAMIQFGSTTSGLVPYYFGGKFNMDSPRDIFEKGLDCSGWASYIYISTLYQNPQYSNTFKWQRSNVINNTQYGFIANSPDFKKWGAEIDASQLKMGDLLVAIDNPNTASYEGHVAIFLYYDEKGTMYIMDEASGVGVSAHSSRYFVKGNKGYSISYRKVLND